MSIMRTVFVRQKLKVSWDGKLQRAYYSDTNFTLRALSECS